MGSPTLAYNMKFTFTVPSPWGESTENISLNSDQTSARSQFGKLELTGDFATKKMPPSLSNNVLLVPYYDSYPEDTSNKLLLDRE